MNCFKYFTKNVNERKFCNLFNLYYPSACSWRDDLMPSPVIRKKFNVLIFYECVFEIFCLILMYDNIRFVLAYSF